MNIFHLPNELLLIILKKMNVTDVLYSLVDSNERFNQLIFDTLYNHTLHLKKKTPFDTIIPIENEVLDRICKQILPRINDKVIVSFHTSI